MVSGKQHNNYGHSRLELCWDKIIRYQRLMELICKFKGHVRQEQESFSTWRSTDILTGEKLDSGFKQNKTRVFCSRCGEDLDNVPDKTK